MSDFDAFLRDGRHIFSVCPECAAIHRLSDIPLSYEGEPPFVDWKDKIDTRLEALGTERMALVAKERELKDAYREKAQGEAMRPLLLRVAPSFLAADIDPRDVRTIIEPTEFVEFRGYTEGTIESVRFLKIGTTTPLLDSLGRAIAMKEVGWLTLQVGDDGVVVPTPPRQKRKSKSNAE